LREVGFTDPQVKAVIASVQEAAEGSRVTPGGGRGRRFCKNRVPAPSPASETNYDCQAKSELTQLIGSLYLWVVWI